MELVKKGGLGSGETPTAPQLFYQCPMHPEVISDKPGTCPKCGMALEPREKKPEAPKPTPEPGGPSFYWTCPMEEHRDVVSDKPGRCPKCNMELVKKERKPPSAGRTIYVCDMHREEVYDRPGQCFKEGCNGMTLEERRVPEGSRVVYECADHPEAQSDKPGTCPKDGKKLLYRIVSDQAKPVEAWMCPMHPERLGQAKGKCPDCGTDLQHVEFEQVLAVPASAVIDTGVRRVVFLDRGHGTFDAVEVTVGHRAGEYQQVIKGLAAGDKVVTAGAFLLDAETRLNPAAGAAYFGASDSGKKEGGGHSGH